MAASEVSTLKPKAPLELEVRETGGRLELSDAKLKVKRGERVRICNRTKQRVIWQVPAGAFSPDQDLTVSLSPAGQKNDCGTTTGALAQDQKETTYTCKLVGLGAARTDDDLSILSDPVVIIET